MVSRCDFYSDEEYEFAVQMELEEYRQQLAYEEEYAKYCEEEYRKELLEEENINLMPTDLISKADVLKLLDELGYINCMNSQDYQYNCRVDKIRQEIVEMPIAYDVDKVIEEINQSATDEDGLLVRDGKEPMIWKSKAIKIIKDGTPQKAQVENYTLYR